MDVRQGDFNDAAAVAGCLEGVEGAFLMMLPFVTPAPGFPEARVIAASFREALRQAPPPRLAVLSAVGSQQGSGLGMITATHLLEEALADIPFPTAFLRAGSLLENYAAGLGMAVSTGVHHGFLHPTERAFPMVATADAGHQAARLLAEGWSGRKVVELGSPVSPDDLARAMGEVLGRPVQARAIPRDQWAASLQARGMPPGFIGPFTEMEDGFNSGWIAFGVPGTEPLAGTTTPAQVFTQAKGA